MCTSGRRFLALAAGTAVAASVAQGDLYGPGNYQDPAWMPAWYSAVTQTKAWAEWQTFPVTPDDMIMATHHGWNYEDPRGHPMPYVSPLSGTVARDGYLEGPNGRMHSFARLFNKADPNADKRVTVKFELWVSSFGLIDTFAIDNGLTVVAGQSKVDVAKPLTFNPQHIIGSTWVKFEKEWILHPQPSEESVRWDFTLTGRTVRLRNVQFATACPSPGALSALALAGLTIRRRRN